MACDTRTLLLATLPSLATFTVNLALRPLYRKPGPSAATVRLGEMTWIDDVAAFDASEFGVVAVTDTDCSPPLRHVSGSRIVRDSPGMIVPTSISVSRPPRACSRPELSLAMIFT